MATCFDDLLGGGAPSPLDQPLTFTVFNDTHARVPDVKCASLRDFVRNIGGSVGARKESLPLLKLGTFGNVATIKGSLRSNDNLQSVTGIEGDYDGEKVSIEEAAERLEAAGIAAAFYSSPSHTRDRPRWRVMCPLSAPVGAAEREALCARLNGALGGLLSRESFTASQSYYFGAVDGAAIPSVAFAEGRALDQAVEWDGRAIGRGGEAYKPPHVVEVTATDDSDDDDWEWVKPADWERIDSALAAIPITDGDREEDGGRDMWLRVGFALHEASQGGDDGFNRWNEWSSGGAKYDARGIRRDWNSMARKRRGKSTGIGTLYDLAKRYGWSATASVDPASEVDDIDAIGDGAAPTKAKITATELRFLTPEQCAAAPSRGYIIKGLFAPRDLGCIFGAPGAGKSLIAPHLGYHVAQGREVFAMRTKPGGVFYVAAEDPHGMRGRINALRQRHGGADGFVLVDGVSDLLSPESPDLAALREAVKRERPALVFLDTLAMAFPGLEENSAEDMGRVVAIGRSLTKWGAAVVLIHHDTKAQGATPRGHSLLNGALDVALHLFAKDEAGVVRGKLTKNRNGSLDRDIAFRIDTESFGEDEDGDAITSALVRELAPGAVPAAEKLTASERAAFAIFAALEAGGAVTEHAWRKACIDSRTVSAADNLESRKKTTTRAFQKLAQKGVVIVGDGTVRRGGSVGNAYDEDDCE